MPIAQMRIRNFRAFADSGIVTFGKVTPIVGRNDAGKSGLLHALKLFFEPPKKGLELSDLHAKDPNAIAEVEVAFLPSALSTQEIQIDAKNKIHLTNDYLVDSAGFFRLRLSFSVKEKTAFEILIRDVDDDALFPLALKDHDALLKLLAAAGLPAKAAGKETNQQKRDALRQKAFSDGKGQRERWCDALELEKQLRTVVPQFTIFPDTADFAIGETGVQNQFKGIVDKALASQPNAKQIEDEIQATIQGEFDKVFERLQRLTDSVTSLVAETSVSWKKAVDGIGLSWGDPSGISIPFEKRGAGVRRLFMVAYFQYQAATSLHSTQGPKYVFAVEEPEVHLHPGAQRELDGALRDLASLGHAVVYTTHSPVFASIAPVRDVVLVERENAQATVRQFPNVDAPKIADELGVEVSDRIVGRNNIVLVEGPGDVEFYETALNLLHGAGSSDLNPDFILFLQSGGIGNLRFTVMTRAMDKLNLKWAVLADSDRRIANGVMGSDALFLESNCPTTCSYRRFLQRSSIENYLDPTVIQIVTGVHCAVPQYGKPTRLGGTALAEWELKKIKDKNNIRLIAQQMGVQGILTHSQDSAGESEFVTIFHEIKDRFAL